MMKPLIGITTFYDENPRKKYVSMSYNYVNSISLAGGIPVLIPLVQSSDIIPAYMEMLDGLLLPGGDDVSPLLYGENPIKEVTEISIDRDNFEFQIFKEAMKLDMPILGICRGIQLMNAASGGTLYQDIHAQKENVLGHCPSKTPVDTLYHSVKIERDSILYNIFQKEDIHVNSFHHQAVRTPGKNFKVTAYSADGIIEGMESTDKTFVVGVQWHPEDLTLKHPEFLSLFKRFVDETCNFSAQKHTK